MVARPSKLGFTASDSGASPLRGRFLRFARGLSSSKAKEQASRQDGLFPKADARKLLSGRPEGCSESRIHPVVELESGSKFECVLGLKKTWPPPNRNYINNGVKTRKLSSGRPEGCSESRIKIFSVTILSEAKRPQIQLSEPGGRVLDLQRSRALELSKRDFEKRRAPSGLK